MNDNGLDQAALNAEAAEELTEVRKQIIETFEVETTKALQDLLEAKCADFPFALPRQNIFHAKECIAELVSELVYKA